MLDSFLKLFIKNISIVVIGLLSFTTNASQELLFNCEGQNLINGRSLVQTSKINVQLSSGKEFNKALIKKAGVKGSSFWQYSNGLWYQKNQDKKILLDLNKFKKSFNKLNNKIKNELNDDFKDLSVQYKIAFFLTGSDGLLNIYLAPELAEDHSKKMTFRFLPELAKIDGSFTLPKRARVLKSANRYVEINEKYGFVNRLNLSIKSAYLNNGLKCKRDINGKVFWPKIPKLKKSNLDLYNFTINNGMTKPGVFSKVVFDRLLQYLIAKRQMFYWKDDVKEKELAKYRSKLKKLLKTSGLYGKLPWTNDQKSKNQKIETLNKNLALYAQFYPYQGMGALTDKDRALLYSDLYQVIK